MADATCGSVEYLSKFPFVHDETVVDGKAAQHGDGVRKSTVREKQDY